MKPRLAWSLFACLVGGASLMRAEHAVEPAPFKWDGKAPTSVVTDTHNWLHGSAPNPEIGLFDAVFGSLTTNTGLVAQVVEFHQLQVDQAVLPLSIDDLVFAAGRPTYTFTSGSTLDPWVPDLRLVGDVVVESGAEAIFDAELSVLLDAGEHGVDVASGTALNFRGDLSERQGESASIVKTGAGRLVLGSEPGGRSTFTGGLEVQEGTIIVGRSSFEETDGSLTSPVGIGTLTLFNNTTLAADLAEPDPQEDGILLMNEIALPSGTAFIETTTTDLILSGRVDGSGGLEKRGTGMLTLSNRDSTFSGEITVSEGTLALGGSSWSEGDFVAGPAGSGRINLADGTTLTSRTFVSINNPVKLTDGSVTFGRPEEPENRLTLTGTISGTADLIVAGQVALEGNSDFSGDVTVASGGALTIGTDNALPSNVALSLFANSILNVGFDQTIERFLSSDVLAEIAIASGAEFTIDLAESEGGTTFFGDISGSGSLRIGGRGNDSIIELAGQNTYTGGTTIESGAALRIGGGVSVPSIAGNILNDGFLYLTSGDEDQPLTIDGVISGMGRLEIESGVTKLAGDNTYKGGTIIHSGATVIAASPPGHRPFGKPQWESNGITVHSGATLALDGANISNILTLNEGSRLTGNGFIDSATIGSGVTLAPGARGADTIGKLTFNDLTLGGGGIYEWNLLDPNNHWSGYDIAEIQSFSTSLHIESSTENPFEIRLITLNARGSRGPVFLQDETYTWQLFGGPGSTVHFPGEVFDPSLFRIDTEWFKTNVPFDQDSFKLFIDEDNWLALSFTPVPEPSTYALLGAGLAIAGLNTWRRRRR